MPFNNSSTRNAPRNRKRKVLWFNPPYSQNVKTNIGKLFLKLVRKYFHKNSKYHKIFNRNTLKLSSCCTINFGNIIWAKQMATTTAKCNCRSKPICSWNNEGLPQCLVYIATSTTPSHGFVYYGTSVGEFKTRCNNHAKLFDTVNAWMKLSYQSMYWT